MKKGVEKPARDGSGRFAGGRGPLLRKCQFWLTLPLLKWLQAEAERTQRSQSDLLREMLAARSARRRRKESAEKN